MAWDCPRFWKLEILWETVYVLGKSIFVMTSIHHRDLLVLRSFWQNTCRDCWKWAWFAAIKTGAWLWSRELWSLGAPAALQVAPALPWWAGCLSQGCDLASRDWEVTFGCCSCWFGCWKQSWTRGDLWYQAAGGVMGKQVPAQNPDGCDPPRSPQGWMVT